ncbi:hypothetical protein A3G55_00290 [Candidatus Giovannonibacteria bacterium RIFCSPLOWO2_12_FULL_44_25]|uniref:Fibronectin type-III domain-containing protein n=2 Tax=Candidatus Giovannoniibacteriota TaxID=1752738 RepID=A0A1F5W7X4_9BACT|nr:MAG: Kef-type K+ transport system, membrane component [Candidatus Giovannonibacteria bacterium GW2011_GWA1_44_25]KKU29059.1 MAG: Kef-type K+ transport system, membrane component [Candidatus Giovannonibacteria bacterium GW2011_GWB1_46_20]OGF60172.1 MAG: hypothetical protein A2656_04345 [Candidatus Giovannonibacteria bacterium RIFCSPHIGHO2_01_FULL_44_100]OGF60624.1 MAG: hypothetical protein A2W40_03135 [Candidatus Giovannonibacteria bacterium RIFCSPHIGHO2_01_45_12]OGF71766.1 MAG: hypothetical 
MKKILVSLMVLSVVFALGSSASAETTHSTQELIDTLQAQIVQLQTQIESLMKAQAELRAKAIEITGTIKLIRSLREGMTGDDIKALQAVLAKYPDIYPEGLISGYFGKATLRAVKRFQERENLPIVGLVGPLTLKKLEKELEKDPIIHEDDTEQGHGAKRPCAIVPSGHLIAPGWLRKMNGVRPVVPECQKLPPGITQKLGLPSATTTPDTTAPVISGLSATNITSASAHIVWSTNENATGKVWYGTTNPVVATSTTPMVSSANLTTSHDFELTGLTASTTYYFVVESKDAANNTATSAGQSFETIP